VLGDIVILLTNERIIYMERFTCFCGTPQGREDGGFTIYDNPLVCPNCGKDNTEDFWVWFTIKLEDVYE
jgi:hypothetical protein